MIIALFLVMVWIGVGMIWFGHSLGKGYLTTLDKIIVGPAWGVVIAVDWYNERK
jgi:hypothetical protein